MKSFLRKNEEYTVIIEAYSSDGSGICRISGYVVFVPNVIVGEECRIKILKVYSAFAYAKLMELLSPSLNRVIPVCSVFGKCGGCKTMHMNYNEELRFKLSVVNDALKRIGKQEIKCGEIIGSESVLGYRNKCIFNTATINNITQYGFYRERSHSLVPVEKCFLQNEFANKAAGALMSFLNEHGISAYNEETGFGTVKHIFCRSSVIQDVKSNVLCIVAYKGFGALTDSLVKHMKQKCTELTGIVLNINKSTGNTVVSGDFFTLCGDANITDTLCGNSFAISLRAFFQINPPQAERLYRKAMDYVFLDPVDTVLDLYCGAGTISLCLAKKAKRVIGAEIVPEAVENAICNAKNNGFSNVEFICADAAEAAEHFKQKGIKPDVIVIDPPRKGVARDAIDSICQMKPDRIVYISCNPATLARDILVFNEHSYRLREVTAVDMFPRTSHVETVCLLVRRNSLNINIDVDVEEMLQEKRGQATYPQIKEYVLEQTGLKVSSLYILQLKRKCGLEVGDSYNKPKSEDARVPQCPPEKEKAIMDALRHFGMI